MGIDAQMYFTVPYELTQDKVNHIAFDLAEAVGPNRFMQYNYDANWCGIKHLGLVVRDEYLQDGPSVFKPENGALVEIMLTGRYYGPGYERGDIWVYIQIAEWVERNVKGASIFYGGDSSGVCAVPFHSEAREEYIAVWADSGHIPYLSDGQGHGDYQPEPVKCGISRCTLNRFGYGPSYYAYRCFGCGKQWESRNGGMTFTDYKGVA